MRTDYDPYSGDFLSVPDYREVSCPDCRYEWRVHGLVEMGAFNANDDEDYRCPDCGRMCDD